MDWKLQLDRAWYMGYEFPPNFLQVEYLDEMPDRLLVLQRQAKELLTQIWITDTSEKSVDEKMTACYLAAEQAGKELFRFCPQRMSYESLYQEIFAEVLCPETVYDLVDYHLREYKKRFAWIRAGRITKDEFYTWSEKTREKKVECANGKITLEELGRWLKKS